MKRLVKLSIGLSIMANANAAEVTIPHDFKPDTPARAQQVNENFEVMQTGINDNHIRLEAVESEVDSNTALSNETKTKADTNSLRLDSLESTVGDNTGNITNIDQRVK